MQLPHGCCRPVSRGSSMNRPVLTPAPSPQPTWLICYARRNHLAAPRLPLDQPSKNREFSIMEKSSENKASILKGFEMRFKATKSAAQPPGHLSTQDSQSGFPAFLPQIAKSSWVCPAATITVSPNKICIPLLRHQVDFCLLALPITSCFKEDPVGNAF